MHHPQWLELLLGVGTYALELMASMWVLLVHRLGKWVWPQYVCLVGRFGPGVWSFLPSCLVLSRHTLNSGLFVALSSAASFLVMLHVLCTCVLAPVA